MFQTCRLREGDQILHTSSEDKPFWEHPASHSFVKQHFSQAKVFQTDADLLRFASDSAAVEGPIVELGVWMAKTTNFLAALNPTKAIYGCDSFKGLPEDWDTGERLLPKGTFAWHREELPFALPNVVYVIGWFDETLPELSRSVLGPKPISLLHIDCDLYSSTATGFRCLAPHLVEGSIISFDDFYNYPNFEQDALKAFNEFLAESPFHAEYIAYNMFHLQAVARLRNK